MVGAMRRTRLSLGAVLLLLSALLLPASVVRADYDPLGSGSTRLSLNNDFLTLLRKNGVKLSAVRPAKLKGTVATFPVSGGEFDPTAAKGTVQHEGALLFQAGSRKIPLKSWQLKTTQKYAPISVKAGGGQLKLGTVKSMVVSREGFGDKVKLSTLSLSAKVAGRLGKKLRLRDVFKQGELLGSTVTKANPTTISVLGRGNAELILSPEFVAKLQSLFVAVNPIFPAEHDGSRFTLPVFGGTIAPDGSQGTLETQGAMEFLQLGGGQVFWHEQWLDLAGHSDSAEATIQPSPPYAGKQGRVGVLELGAGAVSSDPRSRRVAVSGGSLALSVATAAAFNEAFAQGKAVFGAGEALGALSFTAQGQ